MGASEFILLAIGFMLLPWAVDRKTQTTTFLYGRNAKLNRLTDKQIRFVNRYPVIRTVLTVPSCLATASLIAGWGKYGSPLFVLSLIGSFISFVALVWAMGRAAVLAMKTLKV